MIYLEIEKSFSTMEIYVCVFIRNLSNPNPAIHSLMMGKCKLKPNLCYCNLSFWGQPLFQSCLSVQFDFIQEWTSEYSYDAIYFSIIFTTEASLCVMWMSKSSLSMCNYLANSHWSFDYQYSTGILILKYPSWFLEPCEILSLLKLYSCFKSQYSYEDFYNRD